MAAKWFKDRVATRHAEEVSWEHFDKAGTRPEDPRAAKIGYLLHNGIKHDWGVPFIKLVNGTEFGPCYVDDPYDFFDCYDLGFIMVVMDKTADDRTDLMIAVDHIASIEWRA